MFIIKNEQTGLFHAKAAPSEWVDSVNQADHYQQHEVAERLASVYSRGYQQPIVAIDIGNA